MKKPPYLSLPLSHDAVGYVVNLSMYPHAHQFTIAHDLDAVVSRSLLPGPALLRMVQTIQPHLEAEESFGVRHIIGLGAVAIAALNMIGENAQRAGCKGGRADAEDWCRFLLEDDRRLSKYR